MTTAMRSRNYLLTLLFVAAAGMYGCDALEDATTVNVEIPDYEYSFSCQTTTPATTSELRDVAYTNFSRRITVNTSDPKFGDLEEYLDEDISMRIDNVQLIATLLGTSFTISNLEVNAYDSNGTTKVAGFTETSITSGSIYSAAKMKTFLQTALNRMLSTGTIILEVKGQTNLPSGTTFLITMPVESTARVELL